MISAGPYACAGIAIVKSHYPFARAYALADELCSSAKTFRAREGIAGSCLDWHFALSGLSGNLETIRSREYEVKQRPNSSEDDDKKRMLMLRPLALHAEAGHEQRSWDVVQAGLDAFQDMHLSPRQEPQWTNRRNKVKALRDALREGEDATEQFNRRFNQGEKLPFLGEFVSTEVRQKGWFLNLDRCAYFDAIELADWFIPLQGESKCL